MRPKTGPQVGGAVPVHQLLDLPDGIDDLGMVHLPV